MQKDIEYTHVTFWICQECFDRLSGIYESNNSFDNYNSSKQFCGICANNTGEHHIIVDIDKYNIIQENKCQTNYDINKIKGYIDMKISWIAVQWGKNIMPHNQGQTIDKKWKHNTDLPFFHNITACRKAINDYANKHNLISSFVTPQLHRASVKQWEKRNNE